MTLGISIPPILPAPVEDPFAGLPAVPKAPAVLPRNASLVEVVEGKAGGAAATNAGAAIFLGVVAGMAAALGLDPLGQL